jgi:hypothetical protein
MFEYRVKHPVPLRRFALLGSGLLGAAVIAAPPPATVEASSPVAIEMPADPVPAPAPPEPAPVPAVIGTSCVADVTTVGEPLGEWLDSSEALAGTLIDGDGCMIAAWTKDRLFVSWDGGATFATHQIGGVIGSVAIAQDRVAVVRGGNALGTVRAGDRTPTWHDLGGLSGSAEPYELALSAAGRWTLAFRSREELLAVTDDDGATWRHLTPWKESGFSITEDGRTWATDWEPINEAADDDEAVQYRVKHYVAAAGTSAWRETDAAVRKPQAAWTYQMMSDRSWGCCGSMTKIVAFHHGREVDTVVNALNPNVFAPEIVSRGDVTFAMYRQVSPDDGEPERLFRLRGVRSIDLGGLPFYGGGHLVGVDRYGTLIAFEGASVLRWSEGGGWRRLWHVPM